jgi:putative CRISPR-associated protein (TIGR02619 family)
MRTILVTVGTSLLMNARRALDVQELNEDDLARYLAHTDPVAASAETNALSRLLRERDRLVLFHSQTDQGRRCAEALRRHYAGTHPVELVEVTDLTYTESRFKLRGLRRLVALLADRIEKERRQGREVLLNATGGFKAEIAYATLVGLLFDVPVSYIHEEFRDLIEVPAMPVAWDYSTFADWEEFFAWIDGEEPRSTDEVERRWPHLPNEVRVLLEEDDGYTYLSAAGVALRKAYHAALNQVVTVPVYLSAAAARVYEQADPSIRALFHRALARLRFPALRRANSEQLRNCDVLVYPRGHRDERLFWYEEDGAVYVCELARHSDQSYERLLERGVWRAQYPRERFRPWTG